MQSTSSRIDKTKAHLTLSLPAAVPGCIWIHACSVGEVGSIIPLANRLLENGERIHLTVVTRTGFDHAQRLLGDRTGNSASISFLPWDLPGLMSRFIRQLQPRMLLLAETEFWPGMLKACWKRKIKIIGINTRISDRSFPRYRASRGLWRRWLAPVTEFLAQSELDAERLEAIGVPADRIRVAGNLKYAIQPPTVDSSQLRHRLDPSSSRPVLLIASTHEGEERRLLAMLPAWRAACPELLAVIVPRHPERFESIAGLLDDTGLRIARWSSGVETHADIVLIDAMGVLAGLYTIADLVIIGGSLADIGGHNPLEAAVCGRGVVTGPYVQNFRAIMADLQKCGGAIVTRSDTELQTAVLRLLQHPDELGRLHAEAARFMQQQEDVLELVWQRIRNWLATDA